MLNKLLILCLMLMCSCTNLSVFNKCNIKIFNSKNAKKNEIVYRAVDKWIKHAFNCKFNVDVDIIFLTKEELYKNFGKSGDAWTKNGIIYIRQDLSEEQFKILMIHEFGHIFGLDHDNGSCENIMDAVVCTKKLSKKDKLNFINKNNCKK